MGTRAAGGGSGATTCATPYVFHLGHRSVAAGTCNGEVRAPKQALALAVGKELSVSILQDTTAPGGGFPVPAPSASILEVIKREPGSAAYRAVRPGVTRLTVRSRFCGEPRRRVKSCLVLRVHVT
ncbi:MAG: hypothetical protein JO027_09200 [Solirubrobacterales bacterium]|nr:hypothetical protein [Solirubrobacterales bacterium]